jgi:hypothetical protein
MTDVDRYITDEAVQAVVSTDPPGWISTTDATDILRAALPTILAQHERDVRERVMRKVLPALAETLGRTLARLADEAVAQ